MANKFFLDESNSDKLVNRAAIMVNVFAFVVTLAIAVVLVAS